jgi:phospholipid/cholesterol/gamma-HCH transport system ATP-binding protein
MAEEPVLRLEHVSLAFGGQPVLRDVSFEAGLGESVVVLGAAGSGKTVLLKAALGLLPIDSGRIFLFGEDCTDAPEERWFDIRARAGILFQEGGLFDSLSIEDNVAYPLRNQRLLACPEEELLPRVAQTLEFVELGHTLDKYPSELSGGMRRRVGIARAVVTEPGLLLYDSPTAGLDPITAATIIALIIKGRDVRNTATVMATHRWQDGEMMDRFRWDAASGGLVERSRAEDDTSTRYLVLREGAVVFWGTAKEFASAADPYLRQFARGAAVGS